jgi:hypothetical protein
MVNIVGALARDFLNPFINATANVDAEESQYGSPYSWGAVILTTSAALYLAHSCLKTRNITHQTYLDNPSRLKELPRAVDGTCAVYLGSYFVIKVCVDASGENTFYKRRKGIRFMKDAIQRHHYIRLILPKQGESKSDLYMAEERLPIHNKRTSLEIYDLQPEVFTDAVKEFVDLRMRYAFTDLVCNQHFAHILKNPRPRYDNVCPYIENGVGKFGLVDTETFEERELPCSWDSKDHGIKSKHCTKDVCTELVHLFPHHLEIIVEAMTRNGLQLSKQDRQELAAVSVAQLKQRRTGQMDVW